MSVDSRGKKRIITRVHNFFLSLILFTGCWKNFLWKKLFSQVSVHHGDRKVILRVSLVHTHTHTHIFFGES